MTAPAVTIETLEQVLDAFNRHDLDAIMAFFAEDAVLDLPRGSDPWGTRYTGKAAVREGLASRFAGIPDVHYAEDSHWVSGNRGVSEWLLTGTTTAGERIAVRGCDLWEFCDGLIVRKDSYWKIVSHEESAPARPRLDQVSFERVQPDRPQRSMDALKESRTKVVGVDGCRGGWVAMVWDVEGNSIVPEIHPTLADLIESHGDSGAIAIDIPIGLSETGTRRCDFEARKLLGPGRASSVFPPPPPPHGAFGARTHAEAVTLSKALIWKGVPIQAFAIYPKIAEANRTVTPEIQDRVFEVHPEVCFWALAGRPMAFPKKCEAGYQERRQLLEDAIQIALPERRAAFKWARPAQPDDILDALVAAWTAKRVVDGIAGRLPATEEIGPRGLRMEMVY